MVNLLGTQGHFTDTELSRSTVLWYVIRPDPSVVLTRPIIISKSPGR